jgi:hypothetical protein
MGGEHQAGQLAREAAGGAARSALARWLSIVTSTTRIGADSADRPGVRATRGPLRHPAGRASRPSDRVSG